MRIALVTCLLGEYDKLKPIYHFQGFDAICFSDQIFENTMGWTIIPIHQSYSTTDERVRICRRLKIMIHEYLPNYDKWIWTDLSLKWKVNPLNILDYLQDKEIATFSYYNRNCLYEEGSACIKRGKDSESVITKHLKKYQDENFPTNYGLVETTVMIRTNSSLAIDFCKLWWAEVENGSKARSAVI